jgi:hypothetical protein
LSFASARGDKKTLIIKENMIEKRKKFGIFI